MARGSRMVVARNFGSACLLSLLSLSGLLPFALAQGPNGQPPVRQRRGGGTPAPPALALEQGILDIETPDFTLKLVRASQTVAGLQPKGASGFDFTPSDRLANRAANGYNHLGDLTLRVRRGDLAAWQEFATSAARQPVTALPMTDGVLAAADLTPTLPADCPLKITRTWALDNGRLVLRFDIKNPLSELVQIGALGIPMVFDNIITGRSLEEAHETCSFFDPYIGQDAGYLQVTRLNGLGPALLVVPVGKTPFEAYQLLNEPTRPNQTFEGTFAWMVHSRAYADNEWRKADPWNPPSDIPLKSDVTWVELVD